ncbi:MAG: hypothetical protein PHT91_02990 [Candidatus Nanoarchaeia archaeon]|nr:hypothetical protein [Candidatus Nanoarchaeia archaeon]MDD5054390.1 hypothetical protein [Candidatus Nanoarchaeia archaeon]MDD5499815.1 hypothetical protein [Candidatus Nanoarchaeia archaeon]
MEMEYLKDKIVFDKELNDFDLFTFDFIKILDNLGIDYVLISGYVALLFGRSRMTEDIDLFIEKLSFERFDKLWNELLEKFECINSNDSKEAYDDYLCSGCSLNFSLSGSFIPRMEVKFPKTSVDSWSIENKKKVVLNGQDLFISPLELQIAFKIWLGRKGNEKDIEDAKHLYSIFKDFLDNGLFESFIQKLNIRHLIKRYLK